MDENRNDAPELPLRERIFKTFAVELLRTLEDVGSRWLRLSVLDHYTAERQPAQVSVQSKEHNAFARMIRERIAAWPAIADAVLLGRGEAAQSTGRRSRHQEAIAHQLIGVIVLQGGYETIHEIVKHAVGEAPITTGVTTVDWRTLLQQQIPDSNLAWKFDTSGPDHALVFTASVRDRQGRTGRGSGTSKKGAQRAASEDYLRRHLPRVVKAQERSGRMETRQADGPSKYAYRPAALSKAVSPAREMFDLPESADPMLMQALTHSSWAHENTSRLKAARQRDNTLLAHHGSFVADLLMAYEKGRVILTRTLHPALDEAIIMTTPENIWRELFEKLPWRDGVLLSQGQRSNPRPTYAGVMQAILAVAWRTKGTRLLSERPSLLEECLRSQAPVQDAFTRIQRACSIFGIDVAYQYRGQGSNPNETYTAFLTMSANSASSVISGASATSKPGAKRLPAERALRILGITGAGDWALSKADQRIAAFLLRAQIANADSVREKDLLRCALQGHLGVGHLIAGDREAFAAWERQASRLAGTSPSETEPRLQGYYRRCQQAASEAP